jgi:anti-anti-sigma factor
MAEIIRAETSTDHAVVVQLAGDVDVESAREVRERLYAVLDGVPGGARLMVVDLSRAEFVDSSGLGALVAASRRARERECGFSLVNPAPMIARVLEMSGMDQAWPIYSTVHAALADLPPVDST